jgi:hypothetical protein
MTDAALPEVVVWTGDLLWPTALPLGQVIDVRDVTVMGVWINQWLRDHAGIALTGDERVKAWLQRYDLPIRWYDSTDEALADHGHGVTNHEREMLWG